MNADERSIMELLASAAFMHIADKGYYSIMLPSGYVEMYYIIYMSSSLILGKVISMHTFFDQVKCDCRHGYCNIIIK